VSRFYHHRHSFDTVASKYLSDPSEDVRVATEVVLSEFLKEIRVITAVARKTHGELAPKQEVAIEEVEPSGESQGDTTPIHSEEDDGDVNYPDGSNTDFDDRDLGCQYSSHSLGNCLTLN
jgi:vacuole morphology and inheritance protein 14